MTSRLVVLVMAVAACGGQTAPVKDPGPPPTQVSPSDPPPAPAAGDYCAVLERIVASSAGGFVSLRGEQGWNDPDDTDDDAEYPSTLALPGTTGCMIDAEAGTNANYECRTFASNGTEAGLQAGAEAYRTEGLKLLGCLAKDQWDPKEGTNEVTFVSRTPGVASIRLRGTGSTRDGKRVIQVFVTVTAADEMPSP